MLVTVLINIGTSCQQKSCQQKNSAKMTCEELEKKFSLMSICEKIIFLQNIDAFADTAAIPLPCYNPLMPILQGSIDSSTLKFEGNGTGIYYDPKLVEEDLKRLRLIYNCD